MSKTRSEVDRLSVCLAAVRAGSKKWGSRAFQPLLRPRRPSFARLRGGCDPALTVASRDFLLETLATAVAHMLTSEYKGRRQMEGLAAGLYVCATGLRPALETRGHSRTHSEVPCECRYPPSRITVGCLPLWLRALRLVVQSQSLRHSSKGL